MRPATFDIESDHLRPPALLAPNWATASALHDLSPDEGGDVKFVEQAGTVAEPGLGEHELPASRCLEVAVQGGNHGADLLVPGHCEDDGARP